MAAKALAGKSALITGSVSPQGLGYGILRALAAAGANVGMHGIGTSDELQHAAHTISNEFGVKVAHSNADLRKPAAIREMMGDMHEQLSGVDILVNNAGIQYVSAVHEFPEDKWDDIIAVCLSSAFHTTKAALPTMLERKWGRIINTGSMHSLVASPYKSAYNAAKHGIAGFTKTVALETAKGTGVTCNAICPGYMFTALVQNQLEDTARIRGISKEEVVEKVLLADQPSKEFVSVDDVGQFAVFLCSDAARQMTGACLSMDGGWTAR